MAGIVTVLLTTDLLRASFEDFPPVRALTILWVCAAIGWLRSLRSSGRAIASHASTHEPRSTMIKASY
jgi:hypothetical protein